MISRFFMASMACIVIVILLKIAQVDHIPTLIIGGIIAIISGIYVVFGGEDGEGI